MFEKWRIKEHMEVTDAAGRHIGTVDGLDGDLITLTRSDSPDGRHHQIDIECVERISDNRVELKDGVVLPEGLATNDYIADGPRPGVDPGVQSTSYAGTVSTTSKTGTREDSQLFGTSGLGTGMGGSGTT